MAHEIGKLILGTVQFGLDYGINNPHGRPTQEEVFAILTSALHNGIKMLDTAAAYGDAEESIGAFLRQSPAVKFDIISKFHVSNDTLPAESLQQSFRRMHVSHIDTFLYHAFKDVCDHPESLQQLQSLRDEGLIRKIGVSVYTNPELKAAIEIPEIDVIQLPFNVLDNENQRGVLLRAAKDRGKLIHTRSAFLQGLFFKPTENLSEHFAPLLPLLAQLDTIRRKLEIGWAELCLGYACSKPYIDGVLIGVDSQKQLMENIDALKTPLPESVIQKIDEIRVSTPELLNPSNWKK